MDGPKFGEPGWEPPAAPADPADPRYRAAAARAVGQVQNGDQGVDAGETVEQMQAAAVRAAMSDYEGKLKAMMAAAEAQNAQWARQFDLMSRQLATVQQQAGPPVATLLAQSLATRVDSIAKANPDLGTLHFAGVLSQAASLADEVKGVAAGDSGSTADRAEQLANGVIKWFERVHPRISGKFIEGAGAAVDEAERILDELPNLVPVAAALVKAV
jgi:hypothetical protein